MDNTILANPWTVGTLFLCLGMLTGYAVGRRAGFQDGVSEGLRTAPLDLLRTSWDNGRCAICGTHSEAGLPTGSAEQLANSAVGGSIMALKYTKLHGLGNTYIYLDLVSQQVNLDWAQLARKVSNVYFGLGSDGLILILPGNNGADFQMRIFNADGSEGQMCGNGIRSVGKYVYDHGLTTKQTVLIDTLSGRLELQLKVADGKALSARVDMGKPRFLRREIPMLGGEPDSECIDQPIVAGDIVYSVTALSMGNPHAVIFVDDVTGFPISGVGPMLESHPLFPARVNVEFARVIAPGEIEMRVWERGSGPTLACGTGACATAVAAIRLGKTTTRQNKVRLPGGVLDIEWAENEHVYMTGPAVEIASGEFNPEWLAAAMADEQ